MSQHQHQRVMACTHVLEDNEEATSENFPDLLCEKCVDTMASADFNNPQNIADHLPEQVHFVCRNCVLGKVAKK